MPQEWCMSVDLSLESSSILQSSLRGYPPPPSLTPTHACTLTHPPQPLRLDPHPHHCLSLLPPPPMPRPCPSRHPLLPPTLHLTAILHLMQGAARGGGQGRGMRGAHRWRACGGRRRAARHLWRPLTLRPHCCLPHGLRGCCHRAGPEARAPQAGKRAAFAWRGDGVKEQP